MQIPEALSDYWLLVLLAFLFLGPGALFSKSNSDNFWLFGRLYQKFRSRHLDQIRAQETISTAVEDLLRQQVQQLRQSLEDQLDYCGRTTKALERQVRQERAEVEDMRGYIAMLKRWTIDAVSESGGDIKCVHPFPDYDEWKARRAGK